MRLNNIIKPIAKLAVAGATIFAIAFAVMSAEPAPAEADVFFGSSDSNHERFARVIEGSGLKARPYDLNGNVIYFASGQTRKSPAEALHYYQDAFHSEGINSRSWADHPTRVEANARGDKGAAHALAEATLRGEIVPEVRAPNYVTMTGMAATASDRSDFVAAGTADGKFRFADAAQGFRMIEAMWDEELGRTQLTAVWTADDFDHHKMDNTAFVQSPPDTEIPACIGCKREVAFKSLNPGEPFRSDSYRTSSSPSVTHEYFSRSMSSRGWEPTGVQRKLDWLADRLGGEPGLNAGKLLDLRHPDGRTATIAISEDPAGGTRVFTMRD